MPMFIIVEGEAEYKDEYAIRDLLSYMVKKPYYMFADAVDCPYCVQNFSVASSYITAVQKYCHPSFRGSRMHHLVLALDDLPALNEQEAYKIMKFVLAYFGRKELPVLAVYHYRSDRRTYYPHIHFAISHIALNGDVFSGGDGEYWKMVSFLNGSTNLKWSCVRRNRNCYYGDDGDY